MSENDAVLRSIEAVHIMQDMARLAGRVPDTVATLEQRNPVAATALVERIGRAISVLRYCSGGERDSEYGG